MVRSEAKTFVRAIAIQLPRGFKSQKIQSPIAEPSLDCWFSSHLTSCNFLDLGFVCLMVRFDRRLDVCFLFRTGHVERGEREGRML